MSEYIDIDSGVKRVMGRKSLYFKMLNIFLDGKELSQMEEFVSAGDIDEAANASHTIKGVAGNLSLTRLYEANSHILESLRAGTLPTQEEINNCKEIYNTTCDKIRELLAQESNESN